MRAFEVMSAGTWEQAHQVDRVLIDFDHRHRRRILLQTEGGAELLIDLPHAQRLKEGDGLRLEEGGFVRVAAKPEALLEIHAHDDTTLVRVAWHLGNRHLPVQIDGDRILIRADHVIEGMIAQLGAHVEHVDRPFDPEPGAYASGAPGHHHDHHHDNDDAGGE